MTVINKKLTREMRETIFERGHKRPVIVSVEPPNLIGFRLKGTRKTYYLTAGIGFDAALKRMLAKR